MNERTAYHRAYYAMHRTEFLERRREYYDMIKTDLVAYRAMIEKARIYKRRVFGWKRTYKKRTP